MAIFSAAALTALLGAQRTSTTLERFREWSHSSDVEYQGGSEAQAVSIKAAIDDDPTVRRSALRYLVNGFPVVDDPTIPDIAVLADPDGVYGTDIDRMRVLEGRVPDPAAPDEVIVNELTAELWDLSVGASIDIQTFSDADLDVLGGGEGFPGFNGPRLTLQVVGMGRLPSDLPGELRRTDPVAVASAGFLPANPDVGAWPPVVLTAFAHSDTDVATFSDTLQATLETSADVRDLGPRAQVKTASDEYVNSTQRAIDGLAASLLAFAVVAAAAGFLAVGQAATRETRASAGNDAVLDGLGMDRRTRRLTIAWPIMVFELLGLVVGVLVAIAASPLLPTGRARLAEIDPGVWVNPGLLLGAAAVLFLLLAGGAWWSAARTQRRTSFGTATGPGVTGWAIKTFGLRATSTVGLSRVAASNQRAGSVPVRSAVAGVAVALAGVLGAGVVVTSVDSLQADPSRWGWAWHTMPDVFTDDDPRPAIIARPEIEAAGSLLSGTVGLDDTLVSGLAMSSAKGDISLTRLRGRLPSSPAEVALGEQTLHDLGVTIGDSVTSTLADGGGSRTLEIVGSAVFPPIELATFDEGAAFTPDGLRGVAQGSTLEEFVLRYADGVDAARIERQLTDEAGLSFPVFARARTPGAIANLAQITSEAWALAAFFLLIGTVGLFHALTTSVRREGHDFAVLRALGFRRAQVRLAVLIQSFAITAAGLVFGVPIGLVVGRSVWRLMVGDLGIADDPRVPWITIAVVIPLAAVGAVLVAWWPGRTAALAQPAGQLRSE